MRPYQIAATERIIWKIKSAHELKKWSTTQKAVAIFGTQQDQENLN